MNLDPELLAASSADTGFSTAALEKVVRLGELAASIDRHPALSPALVLKGGAALNLCSEAPTRLSVDLDFNFAGTPDRDAMMRSRPDIEAAVERIGRADGYMIQKSADDHAGRKIYMLYRNAAGNADRIEIDLNFMHRVSFGRARRGALWQPTGISRPKVTLAGLEDTAAGKLCAMLDRTKPRDLYDVARLPPVAGAFWNTRQFRRLFVAFSGSLDHPLYSYHRQRLERVDQAQVDSELAPMLATGQRPLANDLIEAAWEAMSHLLDIEAAEREFVDRLQAGELCPGLLLPADEEMAEKVESFPPLLWKVQNAKRHRSSGQSRGRQR